MKTIQRKYKTKYSLEIYRRLLLLLFIVVSIVLTSCSGNFESNMVMGKDTNSKDISSENINTNDNNLKAGASMKTDISLNFSSGSPYKLSDDIGKKVYIKFWATLRPICLGGIDELTKFSDKKANDKNIDVITIVSPGVKGEISTKDFLKWFGKQGYQFKVLLDEGGNVARQFGVRGYPTSVFIDTKGEIAKTQIGYLSNSDIDNILDSIH